MSGASGERSMKDSSMIRPFFVGVNTNPPKRVVYTLECSISLLRLPIIHFNRQLVGERGELRLCVYDVVEFFHFISISVSIFSANTKPVPLISPTDTEKSFPQPAKQALPPLAGSPCHLVCM